MPPNKKSIKRVEKLFSDIKRIENQSLADLEQSAPQPLVDNPGMRHELETLSARVLELETQLKENEQRPSRSAQASAVEARPTDSILYEKEQIGYSYSGENSIPLRMTTLSDSKPDHAINAPLTASGETIGEMQIEPPSEHDWTPEESNLANAVAQQASLQIQNLRLLAASITVNALVLFMTKTPLLPLPKHPLMNMIFKRLSTCWMNTSATCS
jgi:GAF domain-containing protein